MRNLVLFSLLLLSVTAFSQTSFSPLSSATRRVSAPVVEMNHLAAKQRSVEQSLTHQVDALQNMQGEARQRALEQVEKNLFSLFDLSLSQQEMEAYALSENLRKLEQEAMLAGKNEEVSMLRESIAGVNNKINFRRENRNAIVQQRLQEIMQAQP